MADPGTDLYADTMPGGAPGGYLVSTHHADGTVGPDIIIVVEQDRPDRWQMPDG